MSAWIVSKPHIDCLVQAMIVEGIVPMEQADETGQVLWEENVISVQYRYRGESRLTLPGPIEYTDPATYKFTGVEAPLDDLIVWRQLDCYEYQTCEHEGWRQGYERCDHADAQLLVGERRPARVLHDALEAVYTKRYGVTSSHDFEAQRHGKPDIANQNRGNVPWGIDDITEAIARV